LRKQYGGTLVQQVIAKECGHLSEREEAFNAIQCDIKGKSTLIDSLRAYVEGETMDSDNQYRCDQCQSYVDALKRTCIKNLPNHLIFHLKRFDFDFQTMLRTKLNDHFEFPMKLSMREFTYDYLRSKDTDNNANSTAPSVSKSTECAGLDEYELAGVLVHGGSA
ncbi:cysteine proteinase, partial [Saitoella complicata NRRL Y-17804]